MKKVFLFAAASAASLAWAGLKIQSPNVLGIQCTKDDSVNKQAVAMPFTGIRGAAAKLSDTFVEKSLGIADAVQTLIGEARGYYSNWIAIPGVLDETDLYGTTRNDVEAAPATDQVVPVGVGIWTDRSKKQAVYTIGEYNPDELKTVIAKNTEITTTLLVNPSLTDSFDVNLKLTAKQNVSTKDRIYIERGTSKLYYYYDENGWYQLEDKMVVSKDPWTGKESVGPSTKKIYDPNFKIAPGEAFFYVRNPANEDLALQWYGNDSL